MSSNPQTTPPDWPTLWASVTLAAYLGVLGGIFLTWGLS